MSVLKFGCGSLLVALTGFMLGFLLAGAVFISLWWDFPGDWQPLQGLPDAPQQILALKAEEAVYLLRIANNSLYTCREQTCTPEQTDWSTPDTHCDASTRPGVVSLLPLLVARGMQTALACERAYTDIARTVYVIDLAGKGNYEQRGQPDPHRRRCDRGGAAGRVRRAGILPAGGRDWAGGASRPEAAHCVAGRLNKKPQRGIIWISHRSTSARHRLGIEPG
jgi:hypothetical protein